ncbi:MAG: Sua5/YciO/YrdC/YwlC family protein [Prevotella sp.]|nr:Sua5/YciO/YrdC/YwlC family protein [Prevotella sp.]
MQIFRHGEIKKIAHVVQNGGIIIYPTDTIWGLGCNAWDAQAVQRLKQLKGKAADAALIWLLPSVKAVVQHCGAVNPTERRLLCQKHTSVIIHGQAVRVVRSGWLNRLLTACGVPLVATSANPHGQPVIVSWRQGVRLFDGKTDAVVRGRKIYHQTPSTLVAVAMAENTPQIKIIRAGRGISMK